MSIRTYYTLKECIEKVGQWSDDYDTGYIDSQSNLFTSLLTALGITNTTAEQRSAEAQTLWVQNVVGRYWDSYALYVDGNEELTSARVKEFLIKYLHKFNDTWFEYKYMIDIYNDNLDLLMSDPSSSTEMKFNDTPQNTQGVYDWSDDNHLTNVTKTTTTTPVGTKMERINEIQESFRDLYSDWAREFGGLFIYGCYSTANQ